MADIIQPIQPGKMEQDAFIINDVVLRIPPTKISLSKQAYNHEWQTLRTRSSRKIKSGHGLVHVSFRQEFKISNLDDAYLLSKLVAGLRATPFCVVHNKYLEDTLGKPDSTSPVGQLQKKYLQFRPVMLALSSMTFTTMGHEGSPDMIEGQFNFLWFNYLPYTHLIAFKGGADLSQPVNARKSPVWQQFYRPFLLEQEELRFPHAEDDRRNRTTTFKWKEFAVIPRNDPLVVEASSELVKAIERRPLKAFHELSTILEKNPANEANVKPEEIDEAVYDTLYRKLVQQGVINPSERIRDKFLPAGSITNSVKGLISPIALRVLSQMRITENEEQQLNAANKILSDRLSKVREFYNPNNDITFQTIQEGEWKKISQADATYKLDKKEVYAGGLDLYGRDRRYEIVHIHDEQPAAIITQISVTFENILAVIPMVGYRYPTLQHIGSVDARVTLTIDADNLAATDLNKMYDSQETNALRYKQIPKGLNNLIVDNDVLRAFGLKEFVTEAIHTETEDDEPGASLVVLSLVEAGITSDTKLDDPETFRAEFLQSSNELRASIWNEFYKRTSLISSGHGGSGVRNSLHSGLDITDLGYYKRRKSLNSDPRDYAFSKLLDEMLEIYNDFLDTLHRRIFTPSGFTEEISQLFAGEPFLPREIGATALALLGSFREQDDTVGYIPGLEVAKHTVNTRNLAYKARGSLNKFVEAPATFAKLSEQEIQLTSKLKTSKTAAAQLLGIPAYQSRIINLLDRVIKKHLSLPVFQKYYNKRNQLGIDKGRPAYNDFRKQLSSVAGTVEDVVTDTTLLKYDPDCYFYYPLFDGALGGTNPVLIDEYYITQAKQYSLNIYNQAQEAMDDFFQRTYLERLKNTSNLLPYDALVKNTKEQNGRLQQPFYANKQIANSTIGENIDKKVKLDPGAKAPTNWYGENNPPIQTDNPCLHSTNLNDLWNGVGVQAGGNDIVQQPTANVNSVPQESDTQRRPTSFVPPSGSPEFGWPTKPPKKIPKGYTFGQPRKYRNGIHNGVDLGGPATGGFEGEAIYAAADGVVSFINTNTRKTGGTFIFINHGNGWQTRYFHMPINSIRVNRGDRVSRGQQIARVGRVGFLPNSRTPAHLHFEIRRGVQSGNHNGIPVDPFTLLPQADLAALKLQRRLPTSAQVDRIAANRMQRLDRGVTSTLASPMRQAIQAFEEELINGQAQSMLRAYPAFKLYFIEDDTSETKRLAFDDFFSYNAVKSIRVISSKKIPADMCEIYLTNISGILSNRKFQQGEKSDKPRGPSGEILQEGTRVSDVNTDKENPLASLMLQEGIRISVRMGFGNDPDRLGRVFNGTITEVSFSDTDDLVCILAQSDAIELVQDLKGVEKPEVKWTSTVLGWSFPTFFTGNATTGRIIEEMLAEPEVVHFGRWDPVVSTGHTRDLLTQRFTFNRTPADDNIFAPSPIQDLDEFGNGVIFNNLQYVIYRTTIWDVIQEMTLRHPNYIASVVPYTDINTERSTLFFGLPNQLYFHRTPNAEEGLADEALIDAQRQFLLRQLSSAGARKQVIKDLSEKSGIGGIFASIIKTDLALQNLVLQSSQDSVLPGHPPLWSKDALKENVASKFFHRLRLNQAKVAGYVRPFRQYHLLTSSQHIIANNIKATSRDIANTITIKYGEKISIKGGFGEAIDNVAIKGEEQQFTLKLDNAIPTEDMRTQLAQFINVHNEDLAKRYALGLLLENVRDIYKGEISIICNPEIKPYDVCLDGDTPILTSIGYKAIKDIEIGELVYTHKGNLLKVSQLFQRKPAEQIYKVKCKNDPEPLIITENHPVFSLLDRDIYDRARPWIRRKQSDFSPKFRPIGLLQEKDYIAIPRIHSDNSLSPALARLIGLYLAEGCILWQTRDLKKNIRVPVAIQWAFDSIKENYMLDEINQLLQQLGYKKKAKGYKDPRSNGWSVIFYDRHLSQQFIDLAGFNTKTDKETKWLRNFYDTETTKHILGGYFDGDGSQLSTMRVGSLCSAGSSINLGRCIKQLLINAGIPPSSSLTYPKKKNSFGGNKPIWTNNVCRAYSHLLADYTKYQNIGKLSYKTNHSSLIDEDYIYTPISSVAKIEDFKGDVFNIGVEQDNSYIAANKAVHNCYILDEYSDMIGAFEVEEVQHIFSQEAGMRTEIKPDMLVQAAEWSLLSTNEAMGVVMEGLMKNYFKSFGGSFSGGGAQMLTWMGNILGYGVGTIGGFLADKIVNFTQLAQPVVMSPLQHHGRPFTGGVPTRKISTSIWQTIFGQWNPQLDSGFNAWLEDKKDELVNWVKSSTGRTAVGNFFNAGGDSPI